VLLSRRSWLQAAALMAACRSRGEPLPLAGRRSRWEGFDRYDFDHTGRLATVVAPARPAEGRPWLWRAEFFGAFANVDRALLARGWHLAYLDCRNTFGNDETMGRWDSFYTRLTAAHGLSPLPVLLGMSRGGVFAYRWAARHPDRVGLIYGDAPVCDVKSWPGGLMQGKGSPKDWKVFQAAYGFTEEQARAWRGNPIDILAPIARARLPILHVVGLADDVVPPAENTAVLKARYEALGGKITVIEKKGIGHHPHGLADPAPIVDFILAHARRV
jgi:pimeloyl-ACP methyl ester carboxylesterase